MGDVYSCCRPAGAEGQEVHPQELVRAASHRQRCQSASEPSVCSRTWTSKPLGRLMFLRVKPLLSQSPMEDLEATE